MLQQLLCAMLYREASWVTSSSTTRIFTIRPACSRLRTRHVDFIEALTTFSGHFTSPGSQCKSMQSNFTLLIRLNVGRVDGIHKCLLRPLCSMRVSAEPGLFKQRLSQKHQLTALSSPCVTEMWLSVLYLSQSLSLSSHTSHSS